MNSERKHTAGSIKISEDVIIKIAETAACEIEGIAARGQHLETAAKLGFKAPVRARVNGESAAIHLNISVIDGYNAVTVAEGVQRSVKSAVQNMTGFTVTKVDVDVTGVSFQGASADNEVSR